MNKIGKFVLGFMLIASVAFADTWRLNWDAVTQYTDNTPVTGVVQYDMWIANDNVGTGAKQIASDITGLTTTFDPYSLGFLKNQNVFFLGSATVDNVSSDNAIMAWKVPPKKPKTPVNFNATR